MSKGFPYRYSNFGTYGQLVDDGLTQWHPAFLHLGHALEACAARHRAFCQHCITKHKRGGRRSRWGCQWLPQVSRGQGADPALAQLPRWERRSQAEPGATPPAALLRVADRFMRADSVSQAAALR